MHTNVVGRKTQGGEGKLGTSTCHLHYDRQLARPRAAARGPAHTTKYSTCNNLLAQCTRSVHTAATHATTQDQAALPGTVP